MRATVLAAIANQKRPGGRLIPVNGAEFAPYAVTWLNGEEWENEPGNSGEQSLPSRANGSIYTDYREAE